MKTKSCFAAILCVVIAITAVFGETVAAPSLCPGDGWISDSPDYNPCDDATEPDPCPASVNMWESDDIRVRRSPDLTNHDPWKTSLPHENPIAQTTNYVYVKLRNRFCYTGGDIKVYWALASTGLIWDPGNENWVGHSSTTGDLIGTVMVPSLKYTDEHVAEFVWIPPAAAVGHTCLLARFVGLPNTGADPGMFIPETWDINYNTRNNNNIARKNLIVVSGEGRSGEGFLVRNVKGVAANVDLEFNAAGGGNGIPFLDVGSVRVVLAPEMFNNWMGAGGQGQGIIVNPNDSSVSLTSPLAKILGIPMGAYETQLVTMYFTPGGPNALALQRFRVSQFSDGQTTPDGGVTFEFRFGAIPTLSEWGLIIFSLLLLGTIVWYLRRRKLAPAALGIFLIVFAVSFYFSSTQCVETTGVSTYDTHI